MTDEPILAFADPFGWETWLAAEGARAGGIWLRLAKRESKAKAAGVSYDEALDIALCYGWIDGQKRPLDAAFWLQRFTPRKRTSRWSKANRERAERLIAEGRMRDAGLREVERARADGRLERAYDGARTAAVPADLAQALGAEPAAAAAFTALDGANRYAILYRVADAKRPETRSRRIETFVAMLARGETLHPQRSRRRTGEPSPPASAP